MNKIYKVIDNAGIFVGVFIIFAVKRCKNAHEFL